MLPSLLSCVISRKKKYSSAIALRDADDLFIKDHLLFSCWVYLFTVINQYGIERNILGSFKCLLLWLLLCYYSVWLSEIKRRKGKNNKWWRSQLGIFQIKLTPFVPSVRVPQLIVRKERNTRFRSIPLETTQPVEDHADQSDDHNSSCRFWREFSWGESCFEWSYILGLLSISPAASHLRSYQKRIVHMWTIVLMYCCRLLSVSMAVSHPAQIVGKEERTGFVSKKTVHSWVLRTIREGFLRAFVGFTR